MRKLWPVVRSLLAGGVITSGVVALFLLYSAHTSKPMMCLVQIDGMSMYPTLRPGEQVLFARLPLAAGEIVLADVAEQLPVVKRIDRVQTRVILLDGDNRALSATYTTTAANVIGVMLCKLPFSSPLPQVSDDLPMLATGGKPPR